MINKTFKNNWEDKPTDEKTAKHMSAEQEAHMGMWRYQRPEFSKELTESTAKEIISRFHSFENISSVEKIPSIGNQVFKIDDNFFFRFAWNQAGAAKLEMEKKMLAILEKKLQVKVPKFAVYASAIPETGLPCTGYPRVPGQELERLPAGRSWARSFVDFLEALQNINPTKTNVPGVPTIDYREKYNDYRLDAIQYVYPQLTEELAGDIDRMYKEYLEGDNFNYQPTLVHGDLGWDHILWDTDAKRISGIIDWGSMHIGDPCYDLWRVKAMWGDNFFKDLLEFGRLPNLSRKGLKAKLRFFAVAQSTLRFTRCVVVDKWEKGIETEKRNLAKFVYGRGAER